MKTIGLIGGTSWVSTVEYYRIINEEINRRLGGFEAARCILYSFNFGDIVRLKQEHEDQRGVQTLMQETAKVLVSTGADCIVLCANTLHMFADDVQKLIPVPIIHIATATAVRIRQQGLSKVGLLGTRYTMEQDFYVRRLKEAQIEVIIPETDARNFIHAAIMDELVRGILRQDVRAKLLDIIRGLSQQGAEGVILGCTEIPLIIKQNDAKIPLFDTTTIHAQAAVDFALADEFQSSQSEGNRL